MPSFALAQPLPQPKLTGPGGFASLAIRRAQRVRLGDEPLFGLSQSRFALARAGNLGAKVARG
jgi:hypothetical protein